MHAHACVHARTHPSLLSSGVKQTHALWLKSSLINFTCSDGTSSCQYALNKNSFILFFICFRSFTLCGGVEGMRMIGCYISDITLLLINWLYQQASWELMQICCPLLVELEVVFVLNLTSCDAIKMEAIICLLKDCGVCKSSIRGSCRITSKDTGTSSWATKNWGYQIFLTRSLSLLE